MRHRLPFPPWLPIAVVPAIVATALGWLLLVFEGERQGFMELPWTGGSSVMYWADPGGEATLDQVRTATGDIWQNQPGQDHVSSHGGETLWIRAVLSNPGNVPQQGILENEDYFSDRVDAWVIGGKDEALHLLSGEEIPQREKCIAGRDIVFPIAIPAKSERIVLLRFSDYLGNYVRLGWWADQEAFQQWKARGAIAEGVYLGMMLALVGYNSLLWLRLRQGDIGFYVLYLASGAGFVFLARDYLAILGFSLGSPWLEMVLTSALACSALFLTQFAREFLTVAQVFPKTDRVAKIWCWSMLALAVCALATPGWLAPLWMRSTVSAVAITHAGLLLLAIAAWRAGVWQARFFVLSFGCLFAGTLPMAALWLINVSSRDLGMRTVMLGSALEMLLLSLAVANRFARTQRLLVEETEQRRMIEEAYSDELEEEVRERTSELQSANTEKDRILAVIGHDLRGPITGLMRLAEDPTPGFQVEVALTSRALLLMIEDLVLWTRLRSGPGTTSRHQAVALVMPAVALHRALAEHQEIRLLLEIPDDLLIETDLVLAQTLVRNLLDNALKFARTRVTIRARPAGDRVCFSIRNDGPALSPEVAARLTSGQDEPMTAAGGMGLRLCREICDELGILLEAKTPLDGGTEFRFKLRPVYPSVPGQTEDDD